MLKSYRELEVWQRAMDLAEAMYKVTRDWPRSERFEITSQVRRSSGSIAYNIAEGYGRLYRREYVRYLSNARGSLFELESQMILATRVGVAEPAPLRPVWRLAQRVGQMLNRQINALMRSDLDAPLHTPGTGRARTSAAPRRSPVPRASGCSSRAPSPGPRTPKPTGRRKPRRRRSAA